MQNDKVLQWFLNVITILHAFFYFEEIFCLLCGDSPREMVGIPLRCMWLEMDTCSQTIIQRISYNICHTYSLYSPLLHKEFIILEISLHFYAAMCFLLLGMLFLFMYHQGKRYIYMYLGLPPTAPVRAGRYSWFIFDTSNDYTIG